MEGQFVDLVVDIPKTNKEFKKILFSIILYIFEHFINDSREKFRRDSLKALLNNMIAILILYTNYDSILQLFNQPFLQVSSIFYFFQHFLNNPTTIRLHTEAFHIAFDDFVQFFFVCLCSFF